MRVVIADDSALMREGIAAFLTRAGVEVVAQAASADELLRVVEAHAPDLAIIDIRMPPDFTDEGLRAAHEIRSRSSEIAIVILSQHVETGVASRLLAESPGRLAYLLKDRVGDIDEFAATLRAVAAGASALDPDVVAQMLRGRRVDRRLASLSAREREVLGLLAQGRSNRAIGERLGLSQRGVQKHVTAVFAKLELPADEDDNRRILAVLEYLRLKRPQAAAGD